MLTADRHHVITQKLERLARSGHDTVRFWQEATDVLRPIVPFDFHPCWFTIDPEHLVITGHFNAGLAETPKEIVHGQYAEDDVNAFADLARQRRPAMTVTAATRGDPSASWRWQNLLAPMGFDDALDAVLRVRGTTWGALSLLHTDGHRPYTDADVRLIAELSPALATGTRLSLLLDGTANDRSDVAPAVLIVAPDLHLVSASPQAGRWLEELPDTGPYRDGRLPVPVQVAVVRASTDPGGETTVRLRARSGLWVRIHAASLSGDRDGQTAVVIEAAESSLTAPILLSMHDLTPREREVVDLVLRGLGTEAIAARLFISPYTVQDRLKSVFEKFDVRSRRELVARLRAGRSQSLLDENDARRREMSGP